MVFEEFLKDLRELKGLKQKELAELLFVSDKTISGYENNRRQCTFNFGMEILNRLNVSVLLENNTIKIVKGDIKMNKNYQNNNLDFINFNKDSYIQNIIEQRRSNLLSTHKTLANACNKLDELEFTTTFDLCYKENFWLDENYDSGSKIASFSKDSKKISLVVEGYLCMNMFIIEHFINCLKETDEQVAEFIYKSILFNHATQGNGREIYDAFYRADAVKILTLLPMASDYISLIIKVLTDNHDSIFVNIENGYNPDEISIANELGFYDCSSTPNLYFTYTMDDGAEVLDYESFFEGHDIADAFNYVESYFGDYDDYAQEYHLLQNNPKDLKHELVILN